MRPIFDPGSPVVPSDSMHQLAERAYEIMEAAGIEQELINEICDGINLLAGEANRECQACEQRAEQEEQRAWDEAEKMTQEPKVKTAAEMAYDAKHDNSCVGAFARARP